MGGATLKRGPPPVGAVGQFPGPVFAGNPLQNTRRGRQTTRRRNLIGPPPHRHPRELLTRSRNPDFWIPQQSRRQPRNSAPARNRAICGRGDSQTRTPASRRSRSVFGPRFRRKPPPKHATGTLVNAPPGSDRPPTRIPDEMPTSRFPDLPNDLAGNRETPRQPEIGRFVAGATLRRGPPPVGAVGQFPAPVCAGNPLRNTRRSRQKTRRRNLIDPDGMGSHMNS